MDLSAAGFPLIGGRVEALDGRILPVLVYRRREHRVEVTELPLAGRVGGAPHFSSRDGFAAARWSDGDRAYVAVSDLPPPDLAQFVALFRDAVGAEREPPTAK
jgi:anti-sigma factor RsiW